MASLLAGAAIGAPFGFGTPMSENQVNGFEARIDLLESDARGLANRLNIVPRGTINEPPVRLAQNNRAAAQINVRLDMLEGQMRLLNGQVEGLQFQLTQLQTLIANMQQDNEFRFQELEGGSLGKTEAVTQSGSETLASELPLDSDFGAEIDLGEGGFETLDLDGGENGLDLTPDTVGQPFDLMVQSGTVVQTGDADAQYAAGFEAVTSGDYAFAEEQFRQFIALFPEHPNAANATHWLGETLLQRGQYEEAAELLLEGFELYPNSVKAPDMLLKLGVALSKAGERETACRTFVEALRRYPNNSKAYLRRIVQEQQGAQC